MKNILNKIIATKIDEVNSYKSQCSDSAVLDLVSRKERIPRGFRSAIINKINNNQKAIIAEIKQASPSKGIIRQNFNAVEIAKSYESYGATCLSVLTDGVYFRGCVEDMVNVSKAVQIPVLRKDFIIDEYQIYEAFLNNADAILLIVACLTDVQLNLLTKTAVNIGLDVLVEVHNEEELKRAKVIADSFEILIGINNRDLTTFTVFLGNTIELKKLMNDNKYFVCESGIKTSDDIKLIADCGVNAFLVGEGFLIHPNPGLAMQKLFQN